MNVRVASAAATIYVTAIVVALFVGGLVPVLIIGALLVGLAYRFAAGSHTRRARRRNRDRNR